jgi:endonuclease/exonuclease/phosphatase family metal-dependent hydrolase
LRIVTLNTWKGDGAYTKRLAAMALGLAALSPDIVALQEVLAAPAAGCDTAAALASALGLRLAVLPLRRKARIVEGRTVESTSGLAVLSREPIRAQRSVPLATDPRDGERTALIADVAGLTVACVHFTHLTDGDELRRLQWQEVEAAVAGSSAVIVAGDFNAPIEMFDLRDGFIDSRQACDAPATPTFIGDGPGACVDHIVLRGLTATGWRTALGVALPGSDVRPSDHLAVVADFPS